jgi:hypothetical protein
MSRPSFDPQREVITEEQVPSNLIEGKLISLKTEFGPTLNVRAESSGESLLVLPFEYSHCLHLETSRAEPARLIPVNLQQIGLLFRGELDANISYRFGPLDQPGCRREDLHRADRLQLRNAL